MKYLNSWFCYLLCSTLCSIVISLHKVDISNVLSRMVEYNGCLVLVSVLMLIHYVLDVRLFPGGVKFYGLLSLSHLCLYPSSLDRYFHCFAHTIPFSCSSFRRQFCCCMLGFGSVFLQPVHALAAVLPRFLGHPPIL